jgi:hypothetical protein
MPTSRSAAAGCQFPDQILVNSDVVERIFSVHLDTQLVPFAPFAGSICDN